MLLRLRQICLVSNHMEHVIGRLTSVFGIILLGLVIARLVQLQVFDYEHFAERSLGNRVRIEAVPPIRGLVFDRQVQEARRLLIFTAASINEIGYRLGFNDPAYFSRFFTRETGTTPGRYRRRHRRG